MMLIDVKSLSQSFNASNSQQLLFETRQFAIPARCGPVLLIIITIRHCAKEFIFISSVIIKILHVGTVIMSLVDSENTGITER